MDTAKRLFSGTNVACIRRERLLFQNVNFSVQPGDVLHLGGPNGAGKTSLLRIMCGALPAAAGKIHWHGKPYLENGLDDHTARYSWLPADDASLKPLETAAESLKFWADFWRLDVKRCDDALKKMDMTHLKDMPVRALSTGQKRRLNIARVFLKDSPLWLLDEPLSGLDMKSYDLFVAALDGHCKKGGAAIIASHYAIPPPKHGALKRLELGGKA